MNETASMAETIAYSPYAKAVFDGPYPTYKALSDTEPAHDSEEYDAYFLTRFEDTRARGTNAKNRSVEHRTTADPLLLHSPGRSLHIRNMAPRASCG